MELERYIALFDGGMGEIVEKKSRFIATIAPVETVEEAEAFIEKTRKKYWDARHNCYAFSVGEKQPMNRCSDDGEPSGTAGKPMLEMITGRQIHNIAIVVTRYFGGTLLGTGGLVRAYSDAVKDGLEHCVLVEKTLGRAFSLQMDYTDLGKLQYILAQNNAYTVDTIYEEKVLLKGLILNSDYERFHKQILEAFSARIEVAEGELEYYGVVEGELLTWPVMK